MWTVTGRRCSLVSGLVLFWRGALFALEGWHNPTAVPQTRTVPSMSPNALLILGLLLLLQGGKIQIQQGRVGERE